MKHDCENLDAYLADDLPAEDALEFERHLAACDACRDSIDQQRWIDELLQSPDRLQIESTPIHLIELPKRFAQSRRRYAQLAACGLAAAAMLVVAVGWLELNRQAIGRVSHEVSRGDVANNSHRPIAAPPRATFVGGADVIAVPVESHHADVTIVRIYPTFRPRYANQTAAAKPSAASDLSWSNYSNGG